MKFMVIRVYAVFFYGSGVYRQHFKPATLKSERVSFLEKGEVDGETSSL